VACGFFTILATRLLAGEPRAIAYEQAIELVLPAYRQSPYAEELPHFQNIVDGRIAEQPEESICGDGYVVHTLEASLWCLLRTDSYQDAVLTATNLGEDTDTTAAVAGGLAGILWGVDGIPAEWIDTLARIEDIRNLADRLAAASDAK
jgi:ADP-ribosylglycohydrolase